MTVETRTTIQLSDIKEIEVECIACHTRITWSVRNGNHFIPLKCEKCNESFLVKESPDYRDLSALLSSIIKFSYPGTYILRFALGEPKEKP